MLYLLSLCVSILHPSTGTGSVLKIQNMLQLCSGAEKEEEKMEGGGEGEEGGDGASGKSH